MKLSSLYTNWTDRFDRINFRHGLNVVLAEIRLPENRDRDTHNLGKTTLGRLLDFCLLASRDPKFFLFKHEEAFEGLVFLLELELLDGSYITVRRSVKEASKASFKKHANLHEDFSYLAESHWDHYDLPFERAKELLDGILDLRDLEPWSYRKGLGYLLRSQDDYRSIFQLKNFVGAHSDWKPFVAHVLGFDAAALVEHYKKETELKQKEATAQTIQAELGGSIEDVSKVEGILMLKQREAEKKQKLLDLFDFRIPDKDSLKEVVDKLDEQIAWLNARRYSLSQNKKKISNTLDDEQILFDPEEAQRIFYEAGVLFAGQIKRDFEQLISFNRALTDERRVYLLEEKLEIETELKQVTAELSSLGKQRSEMLSFLSDTDIFSKYRHVSDELVTLKADIASLEKQRQFLHRLQTLRTEVRALLEEKGQIQLRIESDVEKQNSDSGSLFSSIRVCFSEIVEEVLNRKALLSVAPNQYGHLDFKAEILDESGNSTSADLGHTYRKLLCIAFDLAVVSCHLESKFPRFVFHDGAFESLDDRKKENLLAVFRQYSEMGIQEIITTIDSDLPSRTDKFDEVFTADEIVLLLHDEGDAGRLFKMKSW